LADSRTATKLLALAEYVPIVLYDLSRVVLTHQ
jgi:hypothetical protein